MRSMDMASNEDQQAGSAGPVDLLVCMTCRSANTVDPSENAGDMRAGTQLLTALRQVEMPQSVRVVPVECLSNCTRGCSVALRGKGRWTYIYGNLDPGMVDVLVEGSRLYAATLDGLVPWRARPEHFRKNCIARIPPLEE